MGSVRWNRELIKLASVFFAIYFVQGLIVQGGGFVGLPISYLIKNVLKLDPASAQFFGAVASLAWLVKPILGYVSDTFPVAGYRRKTYLVGMSFAASFTWFMLAYFAHHQQYTYWTLLLLFNLSAMAFAFVDVVCDGLMVENGKRVGLIDQFVNTQWVAVGAAGVIVGIGSGYLAEIANTRPDFYQYIFGLAGIIPLVSTAIILAFVKEEPVAASFPWIKFAAFSTVAALVFSGAILAMPWFLGFATGTKILAAFLGFAGVSFAVWFWAGRPRLFWVISIFLFFWTFSPSVGMARFYYLADVLKFSEKFFGFLNSLDSFLGIFGIVLYMYALRKWPGITRKQYIYFSIALGAVGLGIQYLYYLAPGTKIIGVPLNFYAIAIFSGAFLALLGAPGFLAPLALAGDAAKSGKEAVTYAWFMSVFNFGNTMSSLIGGWMYKTLERADFSAFQFFIGTGDFLGLEANKVLILRLFDWVSAFFTLLTVPIVYFAKLPERRKGN